MLLMINRLLGFYFLQSSVCLINNHSFTVMKYTKFCVAQEIVTTGSFC